jgi:hypothetical protein
MIKERAPAPTFTLPSDSGKELALESLRRSPSSTSTQGRRPRLHDASVWNP